MKYIDLHQDFLLHQKYQSFFVKKKQTNWKQIKNYTKITIATAYPFILKKEEYFSKKSNELIEQDLKDYNKISKEKNIAIIKNNQDLNNVINKNKTGIILHIEGLNYFKDEKPFWEMLENWYQLGMRSIGVVWNYDNNLGGGATEDGDLTEFGKKVIQWSIEKKMIIDLSHTNEKTFWSIAKILEKYNLPVYVSHGNVYEICLDERNYKDEQLEIIKKTNGVIGVFFAKNFIKKDNKKTSIKNIIKHIEYIKNKIGVDYIAIGTDFGGIINGLPEKLNSVSKMKNLEKELKKRGYTKEEIEKIFWKNAERVLNSFL